MRQIPVDTTNATVMVAKAPQPKIKDRRTGEIAVDKDGVTLMTVEVMFSTPDEVEILKLTVPEPGVSEDLVMGTPVALTGLVASAWENEFNGQKRHGIAFRAVAVTSLAAAGSASKAA
ncbi:hypothetical protein ABZZ47_26480 [Streptomyces sp. NPDC006465]|jgi:hypothetical protein|uniref:SCO3933 family regulatory protein n=1 Tax=Streptomyces sp. NPDC006465 TaxID=3157174 RepID=UPI0033BCF028